MKKSNTMEPEEYGKTVGEFVAEDYRTADVFESHGIDFCCGGQVSLSEACRERGIDPAAILPQIEAVKEKPLERSQNYAAWELPFLADYIVNTHHGYLNESTPQIALYARKVAEVHGARHPEAIEISRIFDKIAVELETHLREEEEILFPAISRIVTAQKSGTEPEAADLSVLEDCLGKLHKEHDTVGDAIHAIRGLSNGYTIPEDACNTFAVTYQKLQEFEEDLHKHVHLENNILFLKAAKLDFR